MKIAFVTSFPEDPHAPHGGVEAVSVNLVTALIEFPDLEVHVITTNPACRAVARSSWRGITIHRLPRLGRYVLTGAIGAGRRQITNYILTLNPDLVHAHDLYGLMVKGLRIPRVFTIHGFIHGDTLVSGERWARLRSYIWRWIETSAWADQPHIISISPYVRERLAGIATGVIHNIDNPIAEYFFDITRNEHKPTIFSASLVCPRKNTLNLVDAFARLVRGGVDAELRLAGAVRLPQYGRLVQDRIRGYGLERRVTLLGSLASTDVCRELATASIFALVSLEENSPLAIEEAMAAGVPVVTSNRCGMPYLVSDNESGFLINPNDPDEICERLRQLLMDEALRVAMGKKAREIARHRFHPRSVARRTRDVYLQAVRSNLK